MYAPKPTIEVLRALSELRNVAAFNTYLTEWSTKATEALMQANSMEAVYRAQGELAALVKLTALVTESRTLIAKRTQ